MAFGLDDVLIPTNDKNPSVALTEGKGRRSRFEQVPVGPCIHYLPCSAI